MRRPALALLLLAVTIPAHAATLAVYDRGTWRTFWDSGRAPALWSGAHPALVRAVRWKKAGTGVETAELRLAAAAPASRVRLILARVDPARLAFRLEQRHDDERTPAWEVESLDGAARVAFNAGQFRHGRPWGWLVLDGREAQVPGSGPLSMAFVVDTRGIAKLVDASEIEAARAGGEVALAFQSYPTLLVGGRVPGPLREENLGVDLRHRDSRLALGILRDGRILIALTRFDIGGGLLRPVPIGPNARETVAIMGALGCVDAVMLDGGISSQLLVRDDRGTTQMWPAYRMVPLGLVGTARR